MCIVEKGYLRRGCIEFGKSYGFPREETNCRIIVANCATPKGVLAPDRVATAGPTPQLLRTLTKPRCEAQVCQTLRSPLSLERLLESRRHLGPTTGKVFVSAFRRL